MGKKKEKSAKVPALLDSDRMRIKISLLGLDIASARKTNQVFDQDDIIRRLGDIIGVTIPPDTAKKILNFAFVRYGRGKDLAICSDDGFVLAQTHINTHVKSHHPDSSIYYIGPYDLLVRVD